MKILASIYLVCLVYVLLTLPLTLKSKDENWVSELNDAQRAIVVGHGIVSLIMVGVCVIVCPALAITVLLS